MKLDFSQELLMNSFHTRDDPRSHDSQQTPTECGFHKIQHPS